MKLRKCPFCKTYTLKPLCPKCKRESLSAHYKFLRLQDAKENILTK